jgi:hypothetical protein
MKGSGRKAVGEGLCIAGADCTSELSLRGIIVCEVGEGKNAAGAFVLWNLMVGSQSTGTRGEPRWVS